MINLSWWGYGLAAAVLTHCTIVSVTVFLHRHQAHRALSLHPLISHIFRFWLWLTTGIVTREWVAIHRKHHAQVESPDDPHSPQIVGIHRVLFGGLFLYQREAQNKKTQQQINIGASHSSLDAKIHRDRVLGLISHSPKQLWLCG